MVLFVEEDWNNFLDIKLSGDHDVSGLHITSIHSGYMAKMYFF